MIIYYKSDDVARYTDLADGTAQIVDISQSDWNLVLANAKEYSYLTLPNSSALVALISLQTHLYPTNITSVRQAIVHAINYTTFRECFRRTNNSLGWTRRSTWPQFYDLGNLPPYSAQSYTRYARFSQSQHYKHADLHLYDRSWMHSLSKYSSCSRRSGTNWHNREH